MATVALTAENQITIPQSMIDDLGLKSGQMLEVMAYGKCIELVPLQPLKNLRGFLGEMNTTIEREGHSR
ncbi:MAG: AbrB/MazE/SpoVT family DNA-binding domain-containing protein [Planctomycetota bacterium]|jgi:bifunctional DNA-binding transcriptional regulator/antitoxin component of YhaV-PrlF toxin-antitoxin module|nr:AbrB/MazE/SpoVT family DNA-binding domain-containing protein [Planctomycetota bacterium]